MNMNMCLFVLSLCNSLTADFAVSFIINVSRSWIFFADDVFFDDWHTRIHED